MDSSSPNRRQFSIGLAATLGASLAGCLDEYGNDDPGAAAGGEESDDDENESTEGENESEDELPDLSPAEVTLAFENEDGDPVSQGFSLEIDQRDSGFVLTREYVGRAFEADEIEDGQVTLEWDDGYEGTYDVLVEPLEDEDFEPVEDEFAFEGEDVELEFVLEGATGDSDIPPLTFEGAHRIENVFSDLSIGVEGGSVEAGATVVQQERADEPHQRWTLEVVDEEEGYHRIGPEDGDLVWEIEDADTDEEGGAPVVLGEWDEADHQLWTFQLGDEDNYAIRNVNSGVALEIDGASKDPGAAVIQWPFGNGDHEKFLLEEL